MSLYNSPGGYQVRQFVGHYFLPGPKEGLLLLAQTAALALNPQSPYWPAVPPPQGPVSDGQAAEEGKTTLFQKVA
jgi:hypothetical protein